MPATSAVFDFRDLEPTPLLTGPWKEKYGPKGLQRGSAGKRTSMAPKQIRRRLNRGRNIMETELRTLYGGRSIDDWDLEELAKGRPRNEAGDFRGRPPGYVDRLMHEQIVKKFAEIVKGQMNEHTVTALDIVKKVMTDETLDNRGRPRTSSTTKLDAAKFLIEHVVGKPKQHIEQDISVKLQAVLGVAMVNPTVAAHPAYELSQGYIDADVIEDEGDDS